MLFAFGHPVVSALGFLAAGALMSVLVPASTVLAPLLSPDVRASAYSLLMGVTVTAQGAGAFVAGMIADAATPFIAAIVIAMPSVGVAVWALARPVPDSVGERISSGAPCR